VGERNFSAGSAHGTLRVGLVAVLATYPTYPTYATYPTYPTCDLSNMFRPKGVVCEKHPALPMVQCGGDNGAKRCESLRPLINQMLGASNAL